MILIVCHDAGGAEIVSSYIKNKKNDKYIFCVKGPAIKIFKRNIKNFRNNSKIKNYSKINKLIIGTSIKSKLELKYLQKATQLKIYTQCFLDHWVYYKKKLTLDKKIILPNEFLVGDIYSKNIIRKLFKRSKITLIKNPYLKEIKKKIDKTVKKNNNKKKLKKILYLTEPLKNQAKYLHNNYNYYKYDEYSALQNFLNYLSAINKKISNISFVKIRFHPSENKKKYHKLFKKYEELQLRVSKEKELVKDIVSSDFIVGCETTALVIGLIAKKKVFCSIPKNGKKSSLPYKSIMHISKLINYFDA